MIKRTRILTLGLAGLLSLSLLTACASDSFLSAGSGSSASSGSSAAGSPGSSSASSAEGALDLSTVTDPCLHTAGVSADTVVARVGDYEIRADALLYWMSFCMNQYESSMNSETGFDMVLDTVSDSGESMGDTFKQSALETAVYYRILPEFAAKEEITPDVTLSSVESVEKTRQKLGSDTLMEHYFWLQMASEPLMDSLCRAGAAADLLREHFFGEGTDGCPTDAEVISYADEELGYCNVKQILLLKTDPVTQQPLDDTAAAEKKKQAEDLLSQLRAAEDPIALFDTLMNESSEDPGLQTWPDGFETRKGEMEPEFARAALALEVGEISDIVETEYGYHIILRLPPNLDALRQEYISDRMRSLEDDWIHASETVTTEDYDRIDPKAFWSRYCDLRDAVSEELNPILNADSASGDSNDQDSSDSPDSSVGSRADSSVGDASGGSPSGSGA